MRPQRRRTLLPESLQPYLQNPTADGMTVCFLTQKGARDVQVLWRPMGSAEKDYGNRGQGDADSGHALDNLESEAHSVAARDGLRIPGSLYATKRPRPQTPPYRFHAMDPHAKTFRAAFVNDIHNRVATLEAVMKNVKPEDYEMSFLLGDMWTNPSPANGADEVFRTMEAYIRLLHASEKPMIFVRGNHETIGGFAKYMAYLFDIPGLDAKAGEFDQQWQFTLQPGPVWFLALDGGDDFTKRFEKFQPIRKRQAEWIERRSGDERRASVAGEFCSRTCRSTTTTSGIPSRAGRCGNRCWPGRRSTSNSAATTTAGSCCPRERPARSRSTAIIRTSWTRKIARSGPTPCPGR